MRIDQYIFEQGFAPSRERAKALVMAGQVYINGEKAEKPGQQVSQPAEIELRGEQLAYVSRGGLKLEKALQTFSAHPGGKVCMDIGASTGGFTDCMLQNGAKTVYAVDVGYGQLDWKLRQNPNVVILERTNIRHITKTQAPTPVDFFTIDVSFISLKLVFPAIVPLLSEHAEGICLIKPQFEAGRGQVGKNGVVKDRAIHQDVIKKCIQYASDNGLSCINISYSPIKGPKGNIEFLMHVTQQNHDSTLDNQIVLDVVQQAHSNL